MGSMTKERQQIINMPVYKLVFVRRTPTEESLGHLTKYADRRPLECNLGIWGH